MKGNSMSRLTASLQLCFSVAACFFSVVLFTPVFNCLGVLHVARSFASLCTRPWFLVLTGIAATVGPSIFLAMGGISATAIIGIAYRYDPSKLPVILYILTVVYAASFALCLLAAIIVCMAVTATTACLRSMFAPRTEEYDKVLTNPFLKALSLASLGFSLTMAAASTVQHTIMHDSYEAGSRIERGDVPQIANPADLAFGDDSWLALATAAQTITPGNFCAGLSEEDRVALLPDGRALVSPAITQHPDKWITITLRPLRQIYITRCIPRIPLGQQL
jgi:hypothetical protein